MKRLALAVGIVLVGFGSVKAHAAVVAGWDVAGVDVKDGSGIETNVAPFTFYATTSETGRVTARLELGSGVNPSTATNMYGFKISGGEGTNSLAGAIAKNHYMEFSITVDEGYELNLGSIEMNGEATGDGCTNVVLMASIDGFVAGNEIVAAHPANETGGFDTDANGFGGPIDLTASKYQGLTGTVAFRIYGWNSASGIGETRIRSLVGDDLVVFGELVLLAGGGTPTLSLVLATGSASVSAVFDGASPTNYVLQYCGDLTDSNGWNTITTSFASNAMWQVETTNRAGFYRAVAE